MSICSGDDSCPSLVTCPVSSGLCRIVGVVSGHFLTAVSCRCSYLVREPLAASRMSGTAFREPRRFGVIGDCGDTFMAAGPTGSAICLTCDPGGGGCGGYAARRGRRASGWAFIYGGWCSTPARGVAAAGVSIGCLSMASGSFTMGGTENRDCAQGSGYGRSFHAKAAKDV